ncbi:hexose transport-related protein [Meredithblackwellia eburnea MCA 4105]
MVDATTKSYAHLANNTHSSWWRDPGLRSNCFRIVIMYTGKHSSFLYSLGFDGSLLTGLQALTPWARDFHHPAGNSLGIIAMSYYLPKIPTSIFLPYLADKYGRKPLLYAAGFFMLVGAIVGGTSHGRGQLIGSRVLLGVGTAAGQLAASAMVPEIAHPRLRHLAGSYFNTTYFTGSIFAAWLTFAMIYYPNKSSSWAWRVPTFIQGFGPLLLAVGTYLVPESPRWLVKQGRSEEAHQILAKYHANGKMDDPLVLFELKEIEAAIETEKLNNTASWSVFTSTAGGRRRVGIILLLAMAAQWAGSGIVSFYLTPVLRQVGITKPAQTNGINGGLAIWSWICALTGASLVEKFGRRPLFITSMAGMLVCFSIMAGVAGSYAHTKHRATGLAIVPILFLFNAFYAIALTPIPSMYIPEIAPLSMRAKCVTIYIFFSNVAQTFNQWKIPSLICLPSITALAKITWKYYFVYIALQIVYLACFVLFLRETKGLTTEEASVVYDPDNTKEAILEAELKIKQAAEAAMMDKESVGSVQHVDRDLSEKA